MADVKVVPRVVRKAWGWPYRYRARIQSKVTVVRKRTRYRFVLEREWADVWEHDSCGMWWPTARQAEQEAHDTLDRFERAPTGYIGTRDATLAEQVPSGMTERRPLGPMEKKGGKQPPKPPPAPTGHSTPPPPPPPPKKDGRTITVTWAPEAVHAALDHLVRHRDAGQLINSHSMHVDIAIDALRMVVRDA